MAVIVSDTLISALTKTYYTPLPFLSCFLPFNSNKPVLWEQFIIYVTLSLRDLICVTWHRNLIIL
jgi:hypothetical protein